MKPINIINKLNESSPYDLITDEDLVETAISYIEENYNEIGTDDRYFLLNILKGKGNATAKIKKAIRYIMDEYNEIGTDDRYFLTKILYTNISNERAVLRQKEREERIQREKEEKQKQREEREAKGITTYSLRGKKQDVLKGLRDNLGDEYYIREPGIDGVLTIRRNDATSGIRAYFQNKRLPDDRFGLIFEPVISNKVKDKMGDIYNMGEDYSIKVGEETYNGKTYKLTDIPKLANEIKKVLENKGE